MAENIWQKLKYLNRLRKNRSSRYQNLLTNIYNAKCRVIIEIGTHDGNNARKMIETANIIFPANQIEYYGFDLFEELTEEELETEFSLKPPASDDVARRLKKTGASIHLFKGYTKDILPKFVEEFRNDNNRADLAFIDGGHSIETISLDWKYIERLIDHNTIVIFDDYYRNDEKEIQGFGCQTLIRSLSRDVYDIKILKPEDHFEKEWGTLNVSMVKVRMKHTAS